MERALYQMQSSISQDNVFVPMLVHEKTPTPFPMAGEASRTAEDAEARVHEAFKNPAFTRGWVVSRSIIVEITR